MNVHAIIFNREYPAGRFGTVRLFFLRLYPIFVFLDKVIIQYIPFDIFSYEPALYRLISTTRVFGNID